jgi:hypothetical protein
MASNTPFLTVRNVRAAHLPPGLGRPSPDRKKGDHPSSQILPTLKNPWGACFDAHQAPEPFGKVGVGRGQNADDAENIYVYSVTETEILEKGGAFFGREWEQEERGFFLCEASSSH